MKKLLIPTLTVCAALLAGCASMTPQGMSHGSPADTPAGASSKPVHWGYSGHAGPEHWAEISPEFGSCNGKNQSPINLTRFVDAKLASLNPVYQAGGQSIINNGHTVQINYAPGSFITVDGDRFELKQFHFHEPSENHIDGKAYPLEMHLVHADSKGNLAVIAVMFEEGAENPALDAFWSQLPMEEGPVQALKAPVNVATLLPANPSYYRYNGSLTTPPCSEGVRWLVMKTPLTASKAQLAAFSHAMKDSPDNRPLQPLNARSVLQ